jgi:putative membrane protein
MWSGWHMWQWMAPGGWGWMGGMMLFGGLFWILVLALGVAAFVWIVRGRPPGSQARSSALGILEERYAKGEIQREEYLEKKRDLGG